MIVKTQQDINNFIINKNNIVFGFLWDNEKKEYSVNIFKQKNIWQFKIFINWKEIISKHSNTKKWIKDILYKQIDELGFKDNNSTNFQPLNTDLISSDFSFDDLDKDLEKWKEISINSKKEFLNFWIPDFKWRELKFWDKVEKTEYGYNIINSDKNKYAYAKDKKTILFDWLGFKEIEKTDYGYNIVQNNWKTYAFAKDRQTALFGWWYFNEIEKAEYGYNIIDRDWDKRAFEKDRQTTLFHWLYFKEIEKTDYGYNVIRSNWDKYAFEKNRQISLFHWESFEKVIHKGKVVYKTENWKIFDSKLFIKII